MNARDYLIDVEDQLSDDAASARRDRFRDTRDDEPKYAGIYSTEPVPSRSEAMRDAYERGEL